MESLPYKGSDGRGYAEQDISILTTITFYIDHNNQWRLIMVIYKITNTVNNKVYIGQTQRTLETRVREHLQASETGEGFYLHSAIRKYGWDKFTVEVIAETDNIEILNELEKFYISKYNSNHIGYNLAPGGYTNCMSSDKVKAYHDRVMRSPEVRAKISATMKDRIAKSGGFSAEHRQHVSEGLKRFYAEGKRPNYKNPQHLTPEHYKALNDAKNKAVYCIDESNNIIAEFSRVKDAAEWWYNQGYIVKDANQLCDKIKQSYKQDKFIRGLKWIYRV